MSQGGNGSTGTKAALLEVSYLSVIRGARAVWSGLSFSTAGGTLLYVTGANGSGKTTLLSALAGLTEPEAGSILWRGRTIRRSPEFRHQMAYLAHNNGLSGDVTVAENLEYALRLAGNLAARAGNDVRDALASVGLEKYHNRLLRQLSQGQQRRVALARLMLQRAQLWLLDEPFNALDADSSAQFCQALSAHLMRGGLAVVSTHQVFSIDAPCVDTLQL